MTTELDVTPDVETASHPIRSTHLAGAHLAPGIALVVAIALVATALAGLHDALSPLVVGVVLGAVVANLAPLPAVTVPGVRFGARSVLRCGIVLLGLRLSLGDLADLGAAGLAVVAVVVTVTFTGTRWLARRLGVPDDLGLLVATGYSICGASAIAAVDGVIHADEEESAYAIALVTLCGSLSILALPLLADPLGFAGEAFGTWVGGAVHDVGQVVATAATDGDDAIAAATVVKLSRVVLLAPLVATIAISRRRAAGGAGSEGDGVDRERPPLVPLFVVGFLAMIAIRSSGALSSEALDLASTAEKLLLTVALVALGMGVRVGALRRLGGRPLALGLASWVVVAGTAAAGTALVA